MLPEYKTILYTTDLSANSAKAFRHAVAIASKFGSDIHIMHVIPNVDSAMVNYVATVMGEEMFMKLEMESEDEAVEEIQRRLKKFATDELNSHPEELKKIKSITALHGAPAQAIIDKAEEVDADLIVMASHGKGPLKEVFLGRVSERVLRKTKRPVLVSRLVD